ncbi:hypothetical protein F4703DRAFT_1874880, partial [Phycomyces blakesleeanus]
MCVYIHVSIIIIIITYLRRSPTLRLLYYKIDWNVYLLYSAIIYIIILAVV